MKMRDKEKISVTGLLVLLTSVLCLSACFSTLNLYKGRTALLRERIVLPPKGDHTGVWQTPDLAVYFTCSGLPHVFALSGDIVIAKQILNSYPRLDSLLFTVSFLDENGKVITTRNIGPVYRANSAAPERLAFHFKSEPVHGTVAMAFGYRGRFRDYGEDASSTYDIWKLPFTEEPGFLSE